MPADSALAWRAQSRDVRIVRGNLFSAIPAEIIVVAVPIVFAVGFNLFFVVTEQVLQPEAVVRGDKIDAGMGAPAAVRVRSLELVMR